MEACLLQRQSDSFLVQSQKGANQEGDLEKNKIFSILQNLNKGLAVGLFHIQTCRIVPIYLTGMRSAVGNVTCCR